MKPGIPWSIKGIESETREAAKAAARRSGMTLGQWLNGMIQDGATPQQELDRTEEKPSRKRKNPQKSAKKKKKSSARKSSKIDTQLSELAEQLTALSNLGQSTAVNRFVEYDDQPGAERALEAMIDRIESGEAQTRESFQAVNSRLDNIDEKIVETTKNSENSPSPDNSSEFQALESALRNIVDHIETSEKRNRDTLTNMQDRMSEISKRAESAKNENVNQSAPAIAALDARVADLVLQHEQATNTSQTETHSYLEERLSGITDQIDAVRHSTDEMTKRAETTASDVAKKEAHQVEQRVASLIGEARTLMVKSGPSSETLNSIHGEIESLNQRFDDIKAESASDQDLQSLKLAIEQLTSSVSSGPDMQPFAAMEQRLADITQRLDESSPADQMAPQLADLENRIISLDQQLEQTMSAQGDASAFTALEAQIALVGDRMATTEEKLGTLTTIEQSISQLYAAVEESKSDAHQIADGAAMRMAEQINQQNGAPQGVIEPSAELIALEQGLAAVKQSSQAAEQHNQETLEAVHETLEQIISKLADMEARDAAATIQSAPQPFAEQIDENTQPATPTGNADWQAAVQSHLQENLAINVELPSPDQPVAQSAQSVSDADVSPAFNPGEVPAQAQGNGVEQPIELPVDNQLNLETVGIETPQSNDEVSAPTDYIAQARLASMSAAPQSKNPISMGAGFITDKLTAGPKDGGDSVETKKTKSLFSLPFLSKKNGAPDQPENNVGTDNEETPASQDDAPKSSRKRLIMAGLVLLVAAGLAYSKIGGNSGSKPAPVASTIEKPAQPKTPSAAAPAPSVTPEKTSAPAPQASRQNKISPQLVKRVSLSSPQPRIFGNNVTANQTGMPGMSALEGRTGTGDQITAAPVDPMSTASIPPAPSATHNNPTQSNVQSPLGISTGNQATAPAATEEATPATNFDMANLPSEKAGTLALRQAAAQGDSSAQFVIASRYADGKMMKRDHGKAAQWYQKAASSGLPPAQYRLGTLFERGNGVPKDLNAARLWYERAAESGNVKAMHNLAVIYASAKGGQTDYAKAKNWFEKASSYGLKDSQFNLAVIYERGLAGKPSQKDAMFWYSIAAATGDNDAQVKAHSLKNYLSAADINAVNKRKASWAVQRPLKSGNYVAIKDAKWQVSAKARVKTTLGSKPNLAGKILILETQTLLSKLGFDIGGADGVMGSRTANAVRLFQLQNGLGVNGMVTNELLQQLQART